MTYESPVLVYARLLGRLHGMIYFGAGDSEEADVLRDEMDGLWYAMTEADRALVATLGDSSD